MTALRFGPVIIDIGQMTASDRLRQFEDTPETGHSSKIKGRARTAEMAENRTVIAEPLKDRSWPIVLKKSSRAAHRLESAQI